MTPTTIVSTAIATRDWQDVHHDRDVAQAAGSKDIFMNILTTNGLVEKYVVDWAGPDAELKGIAIRLGAPAHPYDTLTFSGTVTAVEDGIATIDVVGRVSLGDHVTGTVRVVATSGGFETVAAQPPQPPDAPYAPYAPDAPDAPDPVVEEGAPRPSRNPGGEA
jgi:acyl dehydratase